MRALLLIAFFLQGLNGIQVTLDYNASPEKSEIIIGYEVFNEDQQPVKFLKLNTPFETFNGGVLIGDPFRITFQETGETPIYTGALAKRLKPRPTDFIVLAAGEKKKVFVDLTTSYELNARGSYIVSPSNRLDFSWLNDLVIVKPIGDSALRQVDFEVFRPGNITSMVSCGSPASILDTCTGATLARISDAFALATQCMPELPVFNSPNPRDDNSIRWLGDGGENLQKVQDGYQNSQLLLCKEGSLAAGAIVTCLANGEGCCDANTIAYVFPDDATFTIHLCPLFFNLQPTGLDSHFGSIIHESLHFDRVLGTGDHASGCSACENLAKSNAGLARDNSDNLEYNAEFSGCTASPIIPTC